MAAQCLVGSGLGARQQVLSTSSSAFAKGQSLRSAPISAAARCRGQRLVAFAVAQTERLRLNNLSPQEGSRRKEKRKGRGYGAGQGGTCGFGMRGQKSRSGSGTRPGFEGGQTSLYRRLPKLKGICGGMGAGVPDFNVINLSDLEKFSEGEEVSRESIEQKRIFNLSGREARLPLKVLADGDLQAPLTIKAEAFSAAAKEKIEAAGGKVIEVPQKPKWTRKLHAKRLAAGEIQPKKTGRKSKK